LNETLHQNAVDLDEPCVTLKNIAKVERYLSSKGLYDTNVGDALLDNDFKGITSDFKTLATLYSIEF